MIALLVGLSVAQTLEDPLLDEVSGMVARSRGGFWAVEDSGNPPVISAFNDDGSFVGTVILRGVVNVDWEDLAVRTRPGGGRVLLVADMGDNDAERSPVYVHAVDEDAVEVNLDRGWVRPNDSWAIRMGAGPADVEAVAFDPRDDKLVVVTKREDPPVVWSGTLGPGTNVVLDRVGALNIPPEDGHRSWPTAMDIGPDGTMYVQTYGDLLVFAPTEAGWDTEHPVRLSIPELQQLEAACLGGRGAWRTTTERRPAPLQRTVLQ